MAAFQIIDAQQVEALLDVNELIAALEKAFGNFSSGPDSGVVQPVRTTVDVAPHKGFLGIMPAFSQKDNVLAAKILTVYPENKDLPSHVAQVLHFNPENGQLLAVIDGDSITAIRTAAASAVATKHLATENPKILAIIGSGVQARSHHKILSLLYKFDEVRVCSRTAANAQKFASDTGARVCSTVEECVKDADIICTTTFTQTPIVRKEWVKEGCHINAVGACRPDWNEIEPELMRHAVIYADSLDACNKESGDIILSKAEVYGEIGEVINGSKEAHCQRTTVYESVGMALEDIIAAKLIYSKFEQKKA